MDIDIIIPTAKKIVELNNPIYYTIRSILAQDIQPKKIVVVENKTNIGVSKFMKYHFGDMITVVQNEKQLQSNISAARNKGVEYCNSDILLFMDDDVVIGKKGTLSTVTKHMDYIDFYCGAQRYWSNLDWTEYIKSEYHLNHILMILRERSFLPRSIDRNSGKRSFHDYSFIGHFGAIAKNTFYEIGGFDENYKMWTYQDTDLMMRLCEKGYIYQIMAHDDIFVYHLSHKVDKSKSQNINRKLFYDKQSQMGIKFCMSHFFGLFNHDDDLSVIKRIEKTGTN